MIQGSRLNIFFYDMFDEGFDYHVWHVYYDIEIICFTNRAANDTEEGNETPAKYWYIKWNINPWHEIVVGELQCNMI